MSVNRQSRIPDRVDFRRKITARFVVRLEPPRDVVQPLLGVGRPEQIENLPAQGFPAVDGRSDEN